ARAWTDLVVPSEATVVAQPCEGSLHDPTPWQNGKANLSLWLANDFEHKLSHLLRPVHKSTGVYSIRPHPASRGKRSFNPLSTNWPPSRSCTLAPVTATAKIKPNTSTTICRLRPLVRFAAS